MFVFFQGTTDHVRNIACIPHFLNSDKSSSSSHVADPPSEMSVVRSDECGPNLNMVSTIILLTLNSTLSTIFLKQFEPFFFFFLKQSISILLTFFLYMLRRGLRLQLVLPLCWLMMAIF